MMIRVMIRVVHVQQGNPRDNGCCTFRGRGHQHKCKSCSWNSAFVRGIYSSWTGSCNYSGNVGGSDETRTFWPCRSNNCHSLTSMLDILVGLMRWRVRRLHCASKEIPGCASCGREVVSTKANHAHGTVRLSVTSTLRGLALAIVQEMLA